MAEATGGRPDYDERTALIVVDMQNDFADPGGSLYVAGAEDVVAAVNREVTRARAGSAFVAYTQDWHPESTPHFTKDGGIWPVHCVGGSWGAELHPALAVVDAAALVRKGTSGEDGYSGFTVREPTTGEEAPTGLAGLLRDHRIDRVVVVGLATDYCVKATALDARALGFETAVVADAVRAVDLQAGDGERALEEIRASGATVVSGSGPGSLWP